MNKLACLMLLGSLFSFASLSQAETKSTIESYDQDMKIRTCAPDPYWCAEIPQNYVDWKIEFQSKVERELLNTKKYIKVNTLWDSGSSYKDMTLRVFTLATPEFSNKLKSNEDEKAKAMSENLCFDDMKDYNVDIWLNVDLFDAPQGTPSFIFKETKRLGACGYSKKAPILSK